MAGWLFIYLAILFGFCYIAVSSEFAGSFSIGIVLFIVVFLSFWTIGRIIVNPENRIYAIMMLVCNLAVIIYLSIQMIRNR